MLRAVIEVQSYEVSVVKGSRQQHNHEIDKQVGIFVQLLTVSHTAADDSLHAASEAAAVLVAVAVA